MKPAFVMLVVCARIYQLEKNWRPTGVIFPDENYGMCGWRNV